MLTLFHVCHSQASCQQTSASDKARLQWYERELSVQTGRAEAALQDKAALEDRIRLLEVCTWRG